MKIQVLGPGCAKCKALTQRTESAVHHMGITAVIEKVTDIKEIMKFGIMMTPGLAVDGVLKVAGKVPTEAEIQVILATAQG